MKPNPKTYYLIIYENGKGKGLSNARPSIVDEEKNIKVLLQNGLPTITRYEKGEKLIFQATAKRYFEYKNTDDSITLFVVCDADLITK